MREHEILTDGQTVWVNLDDGMCIGRFSRFGVDVHNDAETQLETGKQCLDCIHDLPHHEAWERFRGSMLTHYQIEVEESLRPAYAALPVAS